MTKYVTFDVIRYIKDMSEIQKKRDKLQEAYDNVSLINTGMASGVKSPGESHPTGDRALKRLAIKQQIDEIDKEQKAFRQAYDSLPECQKLVFKEFFMSDNKRGDTARKIAERLKIADREVYRIRQRTLDNLAEEIMRILNESI